MRRSGDASAALAVGNRGRMATVALLVAGLLALVAIGSAPAPADASRASASATPKRIVALTPFTANTLAMLGVRPVGIGQTLGGDARFNSRLRGVPVLPLSHPSGPNLEQLAALNPELVLSTMTWRKGHQAMRSLGIQTREIDPMNVAQSIAKTRQIGRLVGKPRQATRLAVRIRRQVARARQGIRKRPRVLMILGVGRTPFAFLPNSWGGDVVRKAGGRLLTQGLNDSGGFARISDELVVQRNPDIIIAVPHAAEDDIPGITEFLRSNPAWQTTRAVRNNRVYISVDNSLLQAGTDVASTIRRVRNIYLNN